MAGLITNKVREQRINAVLGFIFLFKYVTARDLNMLGSTLLGINDMRRTIEYLVRHKYIKNFSVSTPVKTTGFYLLDAGLNKVPKSLMEYEYSFYPVWYKPGKYWHDSGIIEACLLIQKLTNRGYWVSEWMIRQTRARAAGKRAVGIPGPGKKAVYRRRLPDGFFVVNKGVKIAIEYESTRKNIHDWNSMVRDLEHGLKDDDKIDPATENIVRGRDFEAVLFVFKERNTFEVYRKRFDEYVGFQHGAGVENRHEKMVSNPQRFILSTLDSLKCGKVFVRDREMVFSDYLNGLMN